MLIITDLDGTLVDSRAAVTQAYEAAGVIPPRNFWGRSWKEWLSDEVAHRRKNELYGGMLHLLKKLPGSFLVKEALINTWSVDVVTGASDTAARLTLDWLELHPRRWPRTLKLHCEMTLDDKREYILVMRMVEDKVLYMDDDIGMCDFVRRHCKGWLICHVSPF